MKQELKLQISAYSFRNCGCTFPSQNLNTIICSDLDYTIQTFFVQPISSILVILDNPSIMLLYVHILTKISPITNVASFESWHARIDAFSSNNSNK